MIYRIKKANSAENVSNHITSLSLKKITSIKRIIVDTETTVSNQSSLLPGILSGCGLSGTAGKT